MTGADGQSRTRLVLIRHGEANAALRQVVGGDTGCTGLSPLGRRQCEALRDRLARTGELAEATVLLASTLPRAVETAEIIAPALGGLPVEQVRDLCELHPGECDGMTWTEFQQRYGDGFRGDPFRPLSPGGESLAEFFLRVNRELHRLVTTHPGRTVVAACHGGIVDTSIRGFMGIPFQDPAPFALHTRNASITEWEGVRTENGLRWKLHRYNDAAHLADVR